MFDVFGKFDSTEELNKKAAQLLEEGKKDELYKLAEENGIDSVDVEDFEDDLYEELCTNRTAAVGRIEAEIAGLELEGAFKDYARLIEGMCVDNEKLCRQIMKSKYSLAEWLGSLVVLCWNKRFKVPKAILDHVKTEKGQWRGDLELGIPSKADVIDSALKYYEVTK